MKARVIRVLVGLVSLIMAALIWLPAVHLLFAACPSRRGGRLRYCASNQVGDAALLYAAVLGPVWEKVATQDGR
jgi:hypothetical protein